MSLKIIKAGILDTLQDAGRFGYQHLGINPNGVMDYFSASLANALLGKSLNSPLIEMHFPAPTILFQNATIICLTGADFKPVINKQVLPLHQPVFIPANSVLSFETPNWGVRCYMALLGECILEPWLGSYSTNLKAGTGGYKGKALSKNDVLNFTATRRSRALNDEATVLNWKASGVAEKMEMPIHFLKGNEWIWLTDDARYFLENETFQLAMEADRMGYQLKGPVLETRISTQLVSSAVSFGTMQLLPQGQLIVLMADHQTTGGYPRVGNVIAADMPLMAQRKPGDLIYFKATNLETAEEKFFEQHKYLSDIQTLCKLKIEKLF